MGPTYRGYNPGYYPLTKYPEPLSTMFEGPTALIIHDCIPPTKLHIGPRGAIGFQKTNCKVAEAPPVKMVFF